MINKKTKELEYFTAYKPKSCVKQSKLLNILIWLTLLLIIVLGLTSVHLIANKVTENILFSKNTIQEVTDIAIDCVNLGDCEEIKEEASKVAYYKKVKLEASILEQIDLTFNAQDAHKLKIIMLSECAKDYNIDGVASYECKATLENKNTNNTYDCGYLQINQKEKCTEASFAIDYQVQSAYNKLNNLNNEYCGKWNCWSSYKFKDSEIIKTAYHKWNNK